MDQRQSRIFHATYVATGCLAAAARAAILPLTEARRLRNASALPLSGEQETSDALDRAVAALESEAVRRALEGVEIQVFHHGKECGSTVKHSDTLLMFLLKALRPARYAASKDAALPGPARPVVLDIDLSAGEEE